jgi:hypothetical protein
MGMPTRKLHVSILLAVLPVSNPAFSQHGIFLDPKIARVADSTPSAQIRPLPVSPLDLSPTAAARPTDRLAEHTKQIPAHWTSMSTNTAGPKQKGTNKFRVSATLHSGSVAPLWLYL